MKLENVAVISSEDYAEYQELKKRKSEIDYNRLRTGSVVKLKHTGSHCVGYDNVNFENAFHLVLKEQESFLVNYTGDLIFRTTFRRDGTKYNTFIQGENLIHFTTNVVDYITEVIEY